MPALNDFICSVHKIIRPSEMTISSMPDAICVDRAPRLLGSDKKTWSESATYIRANPDVGVQTVALSWNHPYASGRRSNEVKESCVVRLHDDYVSVETTRTNISARKNGVDQVDSQTRKFQYGTPEAIGYYVFVVDTVFNGLIDHILKSGYQPNVVRPLLSYTEAMLAQFPDSNDSVVTIAGKATSTQEISILHIRLNQLRSKFATMSS